MSTNLKKGDMAQIKDSYPGFETGRRASVVERRELKSTVEYRFRDISGWIRAKHLRPAPDDTIEDKPGLYGHD
jgi:hypothetical protein